MGKDIRFSTYAIVVAAVAGVALVPLGAEALTPTQEAVGNALSDGCFGFGSDTLVVSFAEGPTPEEEEEDFLENCGRLVDSNNPAGNYQQLAPVEIPAMGVLANLIYSDQFRRLRQRLHENRNNGKTQTAGLSPVQSAALGLSGLRAGSAGEGETNPLAGRVSGFVNGDFTFGDRDSTDREQGYDFDSQGFTAGADYRFSPQGVVGMSVGFNRSDADFSSNQGELESDALTVALFGNYYLTDRIYLDAIVGYGKLEFDSERRVMLSEIGATQVARGDTDGDQLSAGLTLGMDGQIGATAYTTYLRMDWSETDIDSFRESGQTGPGAGFVLNVDDQDVDTLSSALGISASQAIGMNWGVLVPQMLVEWVHEYEDDARTIGASFVGDPANNRFGISTEAPDSDFFNVGLGVSGIFAGGRTAFLYVESPIGLEDTDAYRVSLGARMEY